MRTLALVTLLVACPAIAAPQSAAQSRALQVAAAFSKHKYVVAEKHGVRREKYKDVLSEPVVRPNVGDYAGVYEVPELEYVINLRVGADGRIQGDGHEGARTFEVKDARIEGAVLTATKAYQDGATEHFEGVFLNRTVRNAASAPGIATMGLGVMLRSPVEVAGNTYDRVFYQLQR